MRIWKVLGCALGLGFLLAWPGEIFMRAQNISVTSLEALQQRTFQSKKPLIVNFWATWCKPCVEELPVFFRLCREETAKMDVVLVNMDFERHVKKVVEPFLLKKNCPCPVVRIPGSGEDAFIRKVSDSWSGALPFTIIFKGGQKIFQKEDRVTYEELIERIAF